MCRLIFYLFSPKEALEMAEHCGLGFVERGVFVPKKRVQRNIDMIAIPRASTKEVYGRVTYVSRLLILTI